MSDANTRRLLDKIALLERASEVQVQTIDKYRKRNIKLMRQIESMQVIVNRVRDASLHVNGK